jgi:hypothetical protein
VGRDGKNEGIKTRREEGAVSRRRGASVRHPSPAGAVSYAETIKAGTPCCENTVGDWRRNPQVIGNSLIYGTREDVSNQGKLFFVVSSPGFEKLCAILKMGSASGLCSGTPPSPFKILGGQMSQAAAVPRRNPGSTACCES